MSTSRELSEPVKHSMASLSVSLTDIEPAPKPQSLYLCEMETHSDVVRRVCAYDAASGGDDGTEPLTPPLERIARLQRKAAAAFSSDDDDDSEEFAARIQQQDATELADFQLFRRQPVRRWLNDMADSEDEASWTLPVVGP